MVRAESDAWSYSPGALMGQHAAPWCSGLTCQPVTLEIRGSNPLGVVPSVTDWSYERNSARTFQSLRNRLGAPICKLDNAIKSLQQGIQNKVDGWFAQWGEGPGTSETA